MNTDGYMFFTQTHKLYVQGARRAICERLEAAFGKDWWERGVELALRPEHRESLRNEIERRPDRDRRLFLDASHFGWIIVNHHNDVFADAFKDTIWTANEVRRLTNLRNEWAHIQNISLAQARRAADSMKGILASLRCEEALEIERMVNHLGIQPEEGPEADLGEDMDFEEPGFGSPDLRIGPWSLWHQIRSYLVVDKSVEFFQDERRDTRQAQVTVRVHNTAPDSSDWPSVHFKSVRVNVVGGNAEDLGNLAPGKSAETHFTFPVMRLVDVDIKVEYQIDGNRLWAFQHSTHLPAEIISPLQKEFVGRLEAVGIKDFIDRTLEEIGNPDQSMTIADIARIRGNIKVFAASSTEKREALGVITQEFNLNRESTLGGRTREIVLGLVEFEKNLIALDEAIGLTDLALITNAVGNLRQTQLAVLRVEDTIRSMASAN